MSRYAEMETYSQAGDWLTSTFRRNPEALLLMAAGCVLLMRSGAAKWSDGRSGSQYREPDAGQRASHDWEASNMRRGVSQAAESASAYAAEIKDRAADIKDRVSDAAGAYAESVADFADRTRRTVVRESERWTRQAQSGFHRVLRDQPLAVAALGVAAGAALAAAFPATEIEKRTLGGAHDALTDAASKAGEAVMDAAGKAGERLTGEGLKGLAGQVVDSIAGAASGKKDDLRSATTVPEPTPSGISPATSSGSRPGTGSSSGGMTSATTGTSGRSTR